MNSIDPPLFRFRLNYFLVFLLLFLVEVCIALFVRDRFVRPYLGDGGLGVRPRKVDRNRWYLEGRAMAESISNVHLVQYQEEAIKIQAVGIDGEVVDSLNIPRDRRLREAYYEELLPKEEPPVF